MKTIKVVVTKRRIAMGIKKDPDKCPVALSIRAHKGCSRLRSRNCGVYNSNGRLLGYLPMAAQRWIIDYDKGIPMGPITFKLTLDL